MARQKKVPCIVQYVSDFSGCGFWRQLFHGFLLNMQGRAEVFPSQLYGRDLAQYARLDVIVLQRQTMPHQLEFVKKLSELRERLSFRILYEVDDVLLAEDMPDYNRDKKGLSLPEVREATQKMIEMADEMTVSTEILAEYYKKKTAQKKITVIPNYIPRFWFGHYYSEEMLLYNYRKHKKRPRILYAGSTSHFTKEGQEDDFSHVIEAISSTVDEFCWVFVGGVPEKLLPHVEKKEIELQEWQTIESYPRMMAALQGSMVIAPLKNNIFNLGKSDIKFLEAAALGLPCACQDMLTYAIAPIRFTTGEEMLHQIRATLATEKSFVEASREARERLGDRWLEQEANIGKYLDIYEYSYNDPRRRYVGQLLR